jgi:hypothetical protein
LGFIRLVARTQRARSKPSHAGDDGNGDALDGGCTASELGVLESLLYDELKLFYTKVSLDILMAVELMADNH